MNEIKDYFLIGNLHTAALVSKDGSLDWLCLPRFDSPSLFGKILDERAGSFFIAEDGFEFESKYLDDSAIVKTVLRKDGSEISLKTFMLPEIKNVCGHHFLIRKIEGISGSGKIVFHLNAKPDYGKSKLKFEIEDSKLSASVNGANIKIHLPSDAGVKESGEGINIKVNIAEGESKEIVMEYLSDSESPSVDKINFEKETIDRWNDWLEGAKFYDFCREEQIRSMIALKLMQYFPTGAIVAAPTTSLPSEIGGVRNWDYRFTWMRDATFTLYSFHILHLEEEAVKFFEYIKRITKKLKNEFDIHLMYTINGDKAPDEKSLSHLSGYKNSQPVRIGNGASTQFQLDTYGALIDSYYLMLKKMPKDFVADKELLVNLAEKINESWMERDRGIWEVRKDKYHFTYSKVMCWVGMDRILKIAERIELSNEEIDKYSALRDEIKDWIWKNCYDEGMETFVQYPGAGYQDATNFLFVLLHFLDKHDPRTKKILDKTREDLVHNKIFVYRYLADDGIEGKDNAFLLCTFWMISAYAILEDLDTAVDLFETFEEYMNENGLISEQMNPETGEYLGNYPQAFSHLGFVMSAYYLDKYKSRKDAEGKIKQ